MTSRKLSEYRLLDHYVCCYVYLEFTHNDEVFGPELSEIWNTKVNVPKDLVILISLSFVQSTEVSWLLSTDFVRFSWKFKYLNKQHLKLTSPPMYCCTRTDLSILTHCISQLKWDIWYCVFFLRFDDRRFVILGSIYFYLLN